MFRNFSLGVLFGALIIFAPTWAIIVFIAYLLLPRS